MLSQLLKKHALLKTKTITIRPLAPWYYETVHALRKEARKEERTWRKTGLIVHKQIFKSKRNHLTNTIKTEKRPIGKRRSLLQNNHKKLSFNV